MMLEALKTNSFPEILQSIHEKSKQSFLRNNDGTMYEKRDNEVIFNIPFLSIDKTYLSIATIVCLNIETVIEFLIGSEIANYISFTNSLEEQGIDINTWIDDSDINFTTISKVYIEGDNLSLLSSAELNELKLDFNFYRLYFESILDKKLSYITAEIPDE